LLFLDAENLAGKLLFRTAGLNENKAKLSQPAEAGVGAWLSLAIYIRKEKSSTIKITNHEQIVTCE
jgi:hypothetical protein